MHPYIHPSKRIRFFLLSLFLFFTGSLAYTNAQQINTGQLKQLKFRYIGPVGNRIISIAGIPGDPLTYFAGAASGGIWKSNDGGIHWKPVFDDKPVHSIGALTIAPSDPQVIYAGTGESFIRSNISMGDGVWKSTDGGKTWKHTGLDNTGRISRIVVHPDNADIVWVAAVGHAYSPQKERGVFMTTDGGKTWKQVLFVDENTGASDIVIDPENPRVLFAGMWQLELKTWTRYSGGPGSGIYKSTDGGMSWKKLQKHGLPVLPVGKIALAMTPAQPERVYALIETGDGVPLNGKKTESGELWRSDNLGKTWTLINSNRNLGSRQAYYTRCAASPDNPNEVYFIADNFLVSIDGGKTAQAGPSDSQPNWDHHEMWIDPTDGNRMVVVGDGGLSISINRGKSWNRIQLPVAQVYHVTTDTEIPYNVLTNRQDGPSMKGPSRTNIGSIFGAGYITSGMWHAVGGGESGFATPDPENPDIIWSSTSGYGPLGGIVVKYNEKTKQYRHTEIWPELTRGHPAKDVKYRFQWTFPLLISPHDHNTVYVGSQYVHRTTDGGQSWEIISPDLTLNDKSKQGFSGGLTGDNINVEYADVIYALDESPARKGLLWAGTNDGLVQVSRDAGKTWTNVTKNIPGLPALGVVRNIDASKWNAGKAYITVDFHQVGNFQPYVYKTENYGKTWKKIVNGISCGNLNYVRNIREDPVRPGLLYLGTENALYVSFNDGEKWQSLMTNLPHTPMYWLDVQEQFNDLVVGTYGRGIWILDDITPLQQLTGKITSSDAALFDPRPAYRFQPVTRTMEFFPQPSSGQDPPYGATIHFWLTKANNHVHLVINDSDGKTVRSMNLKGKPGINRIWWDLRSDSTNQVVFRTKPRYAEWYPLSAGRTRKQSGLSFSVLQPPGTYTLTLTVNGKSFTKKLEVLKDPHSEGSLQDIMKQTSLLNELYHEMNTVASEINKIENIRRQLLDLKALLGAMKDKQEVIPAVDSLHNRLQSFENKLVQLKITGTGQDELRYPVKLAGRIAYLASIVAVSDFPPTKSDYEVHQILKKRLEEYTEELNTLLDKPFASFLELLKDHNIGPVITE